jgi:receptor-type tyrosine-protein phosphatase N
MEDHLKKKDRLDREWEALCAYEADPCSTNAANLPQNAKKNRYPDILPYDHSRVILNDLANISGSDYINANTIVSNGLYTLYVFSVLSLFIESTLHTFI